MSSLSHANYFSQDNLELEMSKLFKKGGYCGHISMVPEVGDYMVLPWDAGWVLYNTPEGYKLVSNVCRHRQAQIMQGQGNAQVMVCNIHGWAYKNTDGEMFGAPRFEGVKCKNLEVIELINCSGFLFRSDGELRDTSIFANQVGESTYKFHSRETIDYKFNWKVFLETYADNYHVDAFHPGLSGFVDTSTLKWDIGSAYQSCSVDFKPGNGDRDLYGAYLEQMRSLHGEDYNPPFGACWFLMYPNLMVEFYPGAVAVCYVQPTGTDTCRVFTEFFFEEGIMEFEPELVRSYIAAYNSTAIEDDEICIRIQDGRRALMLRGEEDLGMHHPHLELGTNEFHKFYRKAMNE